MGAAPNIGCQGFPWPGSSPGVPQGAGVKGVQPAEIVQICTIIGLAPGVGRSPCPQVQSSLADAGPVHV